MQPRVSSMLHSFSIKENSLGEYLYGFIRIAYAPGTSFIICLPNGVILSSVLDKANILWCIFKIYLNISKYYALHVTLSNIYNILS